MVDYDYSSGHAVCEKQNQGWSLDSNSCPGVQFLGTIMTPTEILFYVEAYEGSSYILVCENSVPWYNAVLEGESNFHYKPFLSLFKAFWNNLFSI